MIDDAERIARVIDMAAARDTRDANAWLGLLQRNQHQSPIATLANALVIFAHDPILKGALASNAFTYELLISKPPPPPAEGMADAPGPYPRALKDEDIFLLQAYMQRVWSSAYTEKVITQAIFSEAARCRFHPVTDWLDTLVWDGIPRIDKWLSAAFGCDDTAYHRAVGSKFLCAAVRRVRHPGCKFDTMPVLEGSQGIGKSRCCAILFGQWFSDSIHTDLAGKDAAMSLVGAWGLELGEIDHLIRNEVETVKAFLSRAIDRYRPPYGKLVVDRPRQGVLIGTTNTTDYLRDPTGNRRIWPIACNAADADWLALHRDQLWAEACVREAAGETLWLDDEATRKQATVIQSDRLMDDAWSDKVAGYLAGKVEVTVADVMTNGIEIPVDRQDRRGQMRIASILRAQGWALRHAWRSGGKCRLWCSPNSQPMGGKNDELF